MTLPGEIATAQATAVSASVHLRVLATTDLHAHLLPYDYFTDRRAPGIGLARLGTLIARARADAANVLLVDNGDTLQGTPLADAALTEIVPGGRPNPMITAMNVLGYDAVTLGNHDFDFGVPFLQASFAAAEFPVLSANARRPDGTPFVAPSCIVTKRVTNALGQPSLLRIGITGALPPQTGKWNRPHVEGQVIFGDIVTAVRDEVATLRADGADLVLVLAHTGFGEGDAPPMAENVALQLATLPGIDAVVAGHTHRVRPDGPGSATPRVPIVQPGAFGSHLGLIDLVLVRDPPVPPDANTPGPWRIATSVPATLPAASPLLTTRSRTPLGRILADFPGLRRDIARDHRTTRAYVARPLGETATDLETYFSTFAPCAATQVVADAQSAAARPLLAELPSAEGLPLLSAVAPFKAGGRSGPDSYTDVPSGPLKLRHAADLYLYPNLLCLLRITGEGLASWLERSASIYNRIDPDSDQPQTLINHDFAPYNFDRILGLTYEIDVSRPARTSADGTCVFDTPGRIRNLCYSDGTPVAPEDEAIVVTNSYRSAGGGHMQAAAEAAEVLTADFSVRDAVVRHISTANQPIHPRIEPSFSLRPMGGVNVIFETGPGALRHPARSDQLGLSPITNRAASVASNGFQPFLLTL